MNPLSHLYENSPPAKVCLRYSDRTTRLIARLASRRSPRLFASLRAALPEFHTKFPPFPVPTVGVCTSAAGRKVMTAKTKRPSEPRRANKPLMEKRRRARINQSLAALKTLILDTAKADNTKHSKLEKADILELTVRHFQRHRSLDVKGVNHYKAGYSDCVREVQRYLDTPDAQTMTVIDSGVRQRLLRHLDNCISEVDMDIKLANINPPPPPPQSAPVEERLALPENLPIEEVNNNVNNNLNNNIPTNMNINNEPLEQKMVNVQQPQPVLKATKNYDGNFVLLLPEHYLQLASALGVNLRQDGDSNQGSSSEDHNYQNMEDQANNQRDGRGRNGEIPLDYSKNNGQGDMWRPW